jgi:DNA-binding Xre family transcriptional regulator
LPYYIFYDILYGKEVEIMAANYANLWKVLIDRGINKTQLRELAGISTGTLAKLGKNEYVSTEVLDKICTALNCEVGDIIEFIHN